MSKLFETQNLTADYVDAQIRHNEWVIRPVWQRNMVYEVKQQSLIIDSMLMGIPIPEVFLGKTSDDTRYVIDGQQRLSSIHNFMSGAFALTLTPECKRFDSNLYQACNGKTFAMLPAAYRKVINRFPIRIVEVNDTGDNIDLCKLIFSRLNNGSVRLNLDEVRNAVLGGQFMEFMKDLTWEPLSVTMLGEKKVKRMNAVATLTRFFYHYERGYNDSAYTTKERMTQIDSYIRAKNVTLTSSEASSLRDVYLKSLKMCNKVFGTKAFVASEQSFGKSLSVTNNAIFEMLMHGFTKYSTKLITQNEVAIQQAYATLRKDPEYIETLTSNSSFKKEYVQRRNTMWTKALAAVLPQIDKKRFFGSEVRDLLFSQNNKCAHNKCGNPITNINDAVVDHIKPHSLGGQTVLENAQLMHSICNSSKGATV